jgi:hypothetical protein
MEDDGIEQRRSELVSLLQKQVEALEVETYVGLTDAELREYDKRQERIRDLDGSLDPSRLSPPTTTSRNH